MTTARRAAAAVRDVARAVKRDVSWETDEQVALTDLRAEPVNSMTTSTRQNNKACRHFVYFTLPTNSHP